MLVAVEGRRLKPGQPGVPGQVDSMQPHPAYGLVVLCKRRDIVEDGRLAARQRANRQGASAKIVQRQVDSLRLERQNRTGAAFGVAQAIGESLIAILLQNQQAVLVGRQCQVNAYHRPRLAGCGDTGQIRQRERHWWQQRPRRGPWPVMIDSGAGACRRSSIKHQQTAIRQDVHCPRVLGGQRQPLDRRRYGHAGVLRV